jgi:Asp-tRNA(Asn)/Glu-tRNA(Gln) amidotransferase A subunit family amidase
MKDIAQYIADCAHFASDTARVKNRETIDYQAKLKIMLGNYFLSAGNIDKYYKTAMRLLKSEGAK